MTTPYNPQRPLPPYMNEALQQPVFQPLQPKAQKPKRHGLLKAVGVLGVLLLGIGLGAAPRSADRADAAPAATVPARTVTAPGPTTTVPGPTTTTTTTTTVTPKAIVPKDCLLALDDADQLTIIFRDTMNIVADTFNAIQVMDYKRVSANADKMGLQTQKINESKYPIHSASCRAQG